MGEYSRFTKFQISISVISGLMLLAFTVYLIYIWGNLSDVVPSHYNINGTADAWSNKTSSLLMPILGWAIYICLTGLLFIPRMWKVPSNHHNIQGQLAIYRSCRSLLCIITLGIIAMFVYIGLCTVYNRPLGIWFLPAIVIGSIFINVVFLARMGGKKKK